MAGEHDLATLISSMQPSLDPYTYVFATVSTRFDAAGISPRMIFQEKEGITLIMKQDEAEKANIPFEFPCRMITLNIHSALDAVGFLAAVTSRLASLGMGVNPVSGFYHDHLFIPADRADDAMKALIALSKG